LDAQLMTVQAGSQPAHAEKGEFKGKTRGLAEGRRTQMFTMPIAPDTCVDSSKRTDKKYWSFLTGAPPKKVSGPFYETRMSDPAEMTTGSSAPS
jgi:hypothetical protein